MNETNSQTWEALKRHRKNMFWITVLVILGFFLVKIAPSYVTAMFSADPWPTFSTAVSEAIHAAVVHMDLLGYVIAALGLFITLVIAGQVDQQTSLRLEKINSVTEKLDANLDVLRKTSDAIKLSTANLEDASRRIIDTLPGIITKAVEMVDKIESAPDRLLIMNYTSKLGVIHSFNKRFVAQVTGDPNASLPSDAELIARQVNILMLQINELSIKIYDASKRCGGFHLVTYDGSAFGSKFIDPYFDAEDENSDDNLFFYDSDGLQTNANQISLNADDLRARIAKVVTDNHQEAIDTLRIGNPMNVTLKTDIPYQMFLAEYAGENHLRQYESLMIYAVDESVPSSKGASSKRRNIIGISSTNYQLFRAFETLFEEARVHPSLAAAGAQSA